LESDTTHHDYKPVFGNQNQIPSHLATFREWAEQHGFLTIGSRLILVVSDHSHAALFGGLLRFLACRDTTELLLAWSAERRIVRQLTALSEALSFDFPAISVPLTSQPIDKQFRGQAKANYLAMQLSTRRPPSLSPKDQLKVTSFRAWVLLKSLEFAEHDVFVDLSLEQVCAQFRMACDDKGDTRKLKWFLDLIEPATELQGFELALRQKLPRRDPDEPAGTEPTLAAIKALLENRRRPGQLPSAAMAGSTLPLTWRDKAVVNELTGEPVESDLEEGSLYLPPNEVDGALTVYEALVSEDATPPEAARESRGIVFQSQEDQQYLAFAWNRLRPDERQALNQAIQHKLLGGTAPEKLIAALTVVALVCRRSMDTVESLKLGAIPCEEWQLDIATASLHRLPSRRSVRWRADNASLAWITPHCENWHLSLIESIGPILKEASAERPTATTVGELWHGQTSRLETAFNKWCDTTPGLARVSSGLLVRASEQTAFDQFNDASFARLVTSPARAGIPGSGAYPSWTATTVAEVIGQIGKPFVTMRSAGASNALGSELDPDDRLLAQALETAYAKVMDFGALTSNWLEYHNHLAAYTVVMLLAATGARPVTAVFESSAHFDLARAQVFIEDKVSHAEQDGKSGRVIPVPVGLCEFLRDVYLPHLSHLADGLQNQLPTLATELRNQAQGIGSSQLPLFFVMRTRPDFEWIPMSESVLNSLRLLDWPLPWNLFRHRLATRLRRLGLDAELIDAQLGHAEAGSETFGDLSPRCWADDAPGWYQTISTCYDLLCVRLPIQTRHRIPEVPIAPGYLVFPDAQRFGKAARAHQRHQSRIRVQEQALSEIRQFIGNRPIDALAATEWETLGRQMLLTANNLRQPNASMRYEAFEAYVQTVWRESGQRPRMRKWLATLPAPRSAFHVDAVRASDKLEPVRVALLAAIASQPLSTTSKVHAAALAALDICLNGRVTSLSVLRAIVQADATHLRLVLFGKQLHLEYSSGGSDVAPVPATRYLVPSSSARLLDKALSAGKKLGGLGDTSLELRSIFQATGLPSARTLDFDKLITRLAHLIAQENSLVLPGIVAGFLAGRVNSYSLNQVDWIRVQTGRARIDPAPARPSAQKSDETSDAEQIPLRVIGVLADKNPEHIKRVNRQFISAVRGALMNYLAGRSNGEQEPAAEHALTAPNKKVLANTDNTNRRSTRSAIQKILARPNPSVSVATHALGSWVLHLLTRPYRKGLLDAASIKRYLDALSLGFTAFGYQLDLADLDADELTEFYGWVIEPSVAPVEHAQTATQTSQQQRQNQSYVLQRLVEFHRFAQLRYGLDTPDWAEIGEGLTNSTALPGFITEREYQHALQSLCPHPDSSAAQAVRNAFILLLCYRFGLRGGEAISLARSDWVEVAGATLVLVSGTHKKLKTRAARRQVPLLEDLSEHEQAVVHRWLTYWEAETAGNPVIPLFFEHPDLGGIAHMRGIREQLIAALRTSTRAEHINLHHARHAFGNRMALHLIGSRFKDVWAGAPWFDRLRTNSILQSALGTYNPTRRAPWAVARLLGHASPRTTFNSYLHWISDWAAALLENSEPGSFEEIKGHDLVSTIDLNRWTVDPDYLKPASVPEPPTQVKRTPLVVLKYFRLRAQGMTPQAASHHCLLQDLDVKLIEDTLLIVGQKLSGVEDLLSEVASIALPLQLLGHIQKHRWTPLLESLQKLDGRETPTIPNHRNFGIQVGRARQILLWAPEHFIQLRQFVDWNQWGLNQFTLHRPKNLDVRVLEWAKQAGFDDLRAPTPAKQPKSIQIDVATELRPDLPAITHRHRVAAVLSSAHPIATDNYESIVLWLAFSLGQPLAQSAATPTLAALQFDSDS
jgi:integrase